MADADQLKRDFAKLILDHIRENIGKAEPSRFLPEIRRNLYSDRRMVLPMRDPILEAEIVYEDILDAEVIDFDFELEAADWDRVEIKRKWLSGSAREFGVDE